MGLIKITVDRPTPCSAPKAYQFFHKIIQELLAAWYLSQDTQNVPQRQQCQVERPQENGSFQKLQLRKIFNNNEYRMVWIFYAGLTKFEKVSLKELFANTFCPKIRLKFYRLRGHIVWNHFTKTFIRMNDETAKCLSEAGKILTTFYHRKQYSHDISKFISKEFQITLIIAAMEAKNPQLHNELDTYLFYDEFRYFSVPESATTPQILLALSNFIVYCGTEKKWMLQCTNFDSCSAETFVPTETNKIRRFIPSQSNESYTEPKVEEIRSLLEHSIHVYDADCSQNQIRGIFKLIETQKSLKFIILSYCTEVDDVFVEELSAALQENTCVEMLHLNGCNITNRGAAAIANMLRKNKTIKWIGLKDNKQTLGQSGVKLLLEAIKEENDIICMLFLDKNFWKLDVVNNYLKEINKQRQDKNNFENDKKKQFEDLNLSLLKSFNHHTSCKRYISNFGLHVSCNKIMCVCFKCMCFYMHECM